MSELKTLPNDGNVLAFLHSVEDEQRRQDAISLLEVFKNATGLQPKLWGGSIVGYGTYHYKSERSRQEGDWPPLVGFSPRKQNLTVYVMPGTELYTEQLAHLGKHTTSKGSCIYIKKLSDVDTGVLQEILTDSVKRMKELYPGTS